MKKLLLTGAICALLVAAVPAFAQDTTATPEPTAQATAEPQAQPVQPALQASTDFFLTSGYRINVRSGPGTQYTILGKLNVGDSLDVTGQNVEGTWIRVNFNGAEGWVSASIVDVTGDIATAPVVEASADAGVNPSAAQVNTAALGDVVVVTRFNTNLRADAFANADLLATIPFDTELAVVARNSGNNWVQVDFGGQSGWISSGLLFFKSGNINNLPVVGADGVAVPADTQTTTETESEAQATAEPTASS